ncbi:MAG: tRNA pseudouridine(55) synthase TruB [Clostridia bacterium]|nr:tRNA pseudouridine(55) synthase TruB [Clostridia bacterium]
MNGIVVLKKEGGITSQGAVNRIKRLFGVKKAGHTGTLDPMATGVLPILIGRAVKASEYMLSSDKYYRATLRLGITTDTEDTTGNILTECDSIPNEETVLSAISSFEGEIMQTPPMYSALKVGGKKLCDMAREGIEIEREARPITVHSISAKRIDERNYSLDVHCSKGTYIRTLCADIGKALGVGGAMASLERTKASVFTLDDAFTLGELEAMTEEERLAAVVPTERVFEKYRGMILPPFFARLASSGCEIYLSKIGESAQIGEKIRLSDEGGFFALGEVGIYEGGIAVKPVKQFRETDTIK